MRVRESAVEKRLVVEVGKAGGWALKLSPQFMPGIPDRLVLFQQRCWFIEVKTKGGRVSKAQAFIHRKLARVGFPVTIVWSKEDAVEWVHQNLTRTQENETNIPPP